MVRIKDSDLYSKKARFNVDALSNKFLFTHTDRNKLFRRLVIKASNLSYLFTTEFMSVKPL